MRVSDSHCAFAGTTNEVLKISKTLRADPQCASVTASLSPPLG